MKNINRRLSKFCILVISLALILGMTQPMVFAQEARESRFVTGQGRRADGEEQETTLEEIQNQAAAPQETTTAEPQTPEPTTEEPATEEPVTEEPTTEAPTTEAAAKASPLTGRVPKITTEETTTEETATEEPVTEEPVTEEPTTAEPVTEAPTTEPEPQTPDPEELLEDVLEALDNPDYEDTLKALQDGETITQGTYSDAAGGLQQMLVEFGCDIEIDSNAGPATFRAIAQVLDAFGLENTDTVDDALFEELLPLLLLAKDEDGEYADMLRLYYGSGKDSGRYDYLKGCAYYAAERYYKAYEAFCDSYYDDYEDRMAACDQGFPADGELWHNSSVYGSDMYLTFKVNSFNEEEGMCFEVYTEDHVLASVLFLKGSGSVTTVLPGGNYRIKDASGLIWYGRKDAFGREGSYEFMTFEEYDYDDYLTWLGSGYEWTITINVTESSDGSTGVGADVSDWENWAG